LQQGKPARLTRRVVEQAPEQVRLDLQARHGRRPQDRPPQLGLRYRLDPHPPQADEVEEGELVLQPARRAGAEHGHHHDPAAGLACGVDQIVEERPADPLVGAGMVQGVQRVDHQQQAAVGGGRGHRQPDRQVQRRGAGGHPRDQTRRGRRVQIEAARLLQRDDEALQRVGHRADDCHRPARPSQRAALQRRDQPGHDQRRLADPRRPDHRHAPDLGIQGVADQVEQDRQLRLTPVEQRGLPQTQGGVPA
jgi:hypothetical protein